MACVVVSVCAGTGERGTAENSLLGPTSLVLQTSAHSRWCLLNGDPTSLERLLEIRLSLGGSISPLGRSRTMDLHSSRRGIPISTLHASLDASQEVEVLIKRFGGGEFAAFQVGCGISDARALGPLFVARAAGE